MFGRAGNCSTGLDEGRKSRFELLPLQARAVGDGARPRVAPVGRVPRRLPEGSSPARLLRSLLPDPPRPRPQREAPPRDAGPAHSRPLPRWRQRCLPGCQGGGEDEKQTTRCGGLRPGERSGDREHEQLGAQAAEQLGQGAGPGCKRGPRPGGSQQARARARGGWVGWGCAGSPGSCPRQSADHTPSGERAQVPWQVLPGLPRPCLL